MARWFRRIRSFPKDIHSLLVKGYRADDCWEISRWFTNTMSNILKDFRKGHLGHPYMPDMNAAPTGWPSPLEAPWASPGNISSDDSPESRKALEESENVWNATLDRMIELLALMDDDGYKISDKSIEAKDEFFALFSKCFYHLWD